MTISKARFSNHNKRTHIRLASLSDSQCLIALDSVASHDPQRAIEIKEWVKNRHCYLLEFEGVITAYVVMHYNFFSCGFIEMLMVAVSARKKGLGLVLIEYVKSICSCPKLFTSTNQSNQGMQRLLTAAAFIPSGHIENLDEDDCELIYFWATDRVIDHH